MPPRQVKPDPEVEGQASPELSAIQPVLDNTGSPGDDTGSPGDDTASGKFPTFIKTY